MPLVSDEKQRWAPCKQRPLQHYGRRVGGGSKAWQRGEHEEDCCDVDNVVLIELLANAKIQPAGHTGLSYQANQDPLRCSVPVRMTLA